MLDTIIFNTTEFLNEMPKEKRKQKGQFFTSKETAIFMASLFNLSNLPATIEILDPGAGTAILSTALISRIISETQVQSIHLSCYENDSDVLPVLQKNLQYLKGHIEISFTYTIFTEDYILSQAKDFENHVQNKKYDLIIGNPPYLRIKRNDEQALSMPSVVHGAPNLYFLFASISLWELQDNAEMVYIIPRSWTSGEYFKAFRFYFLNEGKLKHIHLFVSRDKVFSQESVLQETIIIKVQKTTVIPETVTITSSKTNNDFENVSTISIPYTAAVSDKNMYVYLPTSEDDVHTIQCINKYTNTLPDEGLRMKTGIVVDFRQQNELRKEPGEHIIPLFYSQHIRNGRVNHMPSGKDFDWIVDTVSGLIQKNKNYMFCKRFTAKEERRRLQCGIYLASDFQEYEYIGTQNKINFIDTIDGNNLSEPLVYGLYALFNSTLFDMYYRILNGSTQVNSTEINNIPVPPVSDMIEIGNRLIKVQDLSTEICDKIISEVSYGE